jgi:hypothetical protein
MTREEAIKKFPQSRWYGEEGQKGWLLDCLEALELIKFEKETNYLAIYCRAKEYLKSGEGYRLDDV